jgi:radical SAM family uncharacterized protein
VLNYRLSIINNQLYNISVCKKHITILADRVDAEFLPFVRKPSRYIGGEINQIKKDLATGQASPSRRECSLTVALCFPDLYEVAVSYTGLAVLYDILNHIEGVAAERAFAPWPDAEKILRQNKIPLFTLESKAALKDFDIIGFSLTTELCYTNVLNMLDLAGLNLRSCDRAEDDPLVIAGGSMANCCEPIADFIDLFVLGEAEETIVDLARLVLTCKKAGTAKSGLLLQAAKKFNWAYVPSLYTFEYDGEKIKSFKSALPDLPTQFRNAVVDDFENAPVPLAPIVPFAEAVHERVSIEIMRGCPGRCRFCQASFCRRPIRFRSVEKVTEIAKSCYHATGFDTIGLLSLSTADYPDLERLIHNLREYFQDKHVGVSIPSLRVDQQLKLLPELVASVRKSGLTIAVEAASEKLRQIINKPLNDDDLFNAVEAAYRAGWQKIKLYFMVGLPGETPDDIKKIVELCDRLARLKRNAQINITVSSFVPKPHTPFAWLPQKSANYLEDAKKLIISEKRNLRAKSLHFKFHDVNRSLLESAIGRGDRRLAPVIEFAFRQGARFDLWDERFSFQIWQEAFEKFSIDIGSAAQKKFAPDEILPWQHLGGPDKKYLLKHLNDAMKLFPSDHKNEPGDS